MVTWWTLEICIDHVSKDEGRTWQYGPVRAPGFVNANAKIWDKKLLIINTLLCTTHPN
jgi:hypothetical protein